ncbi:MAG: type III pantothenate kinase [Candidatus Omnitrophota bacterium]
MFLAIDIGNTSVSFGIFKGKRLAYSWKASTGQILANKAFVLKNSKEIDAAIISSVVPKAAPIVKNVIKNKLGIRPLVLGKDLTAPIKNLYRFPKQVGQDRLVNAVAAKEIYGYPAIVVDFGTAITFDVISKKGDYSGGIIFPGIETSLNALSKKAALLPKIKISLPKELIGRDTVSSMISGVFYGIGSLCDGIVSKIKNTYGPQKVIATGGHSCLMAKFSSSIDEINPDLTLQGLRIIREKSFKI